LVLVHPEELAGSHAVAGQGREDAGPGVAGPEEQLRFTVAVEINHLVDLGPEGAGTGTCGWEVDIGQEKAVDDIHVCGGARAEHEQMLSLDEEPGVSRQAGCLEWVAGVGDRGLAAQGFRQGRCRTKDEDAGGKQQKHGGAEERPQLRSGKALTGKFTGWSAVTVRAQRMQSRFDSLEVVLQVDHVGVAMAQFACHGPFGNAGERDLGRRL